MTKPKQFYDTDHIPYLPNVGGKVLSMLNSGKHALDDMNPNFADFFGLDLKTIKSVVKGEVAPTPELIKVLDKHPALRLKDLYPREYRDKFPPNSSVKDGLVVFRKAERQATNRKASRGPEGSKVHFYTYADTAVDESSLLKPEWIQEFFEDLGTDPDSIPDYAFNKGHFEHQITFFLGPVNFHWIDKDGARHVRQMNTGDSNYVTPFVPHTFTTRKKPADEKAIILAVTYGGAIATDDYQAEIQQMSLEKYLETRKSPKIGESIVLDKLGGVMINRYENAKKISDGIYELMGGIPFQEYARALEFRLENSELEDLTSRSDRWCYNTGNTTLVLNSIKINPGDSALIQKNTMHSMSGSGKFLVIESLPEVGNSSLEEALITRYGGDLARVHTESTRWF